MLRSSINCPAETRKWHIQRVQGRLEVQSGGRACQLQYPLRNSLAWRSGCSSCFRAGSWMSVGSCNQSTSAHIMPRCPMAQPSGSCSATNGCGKAGLCCVTGRRALEDGMKPDYAYRHPGKEARRRTHKHRTSRTHRLKNHIIAHHIILPRIHLLF